MIAKLINIISMILNLLLVLGLTIKIIKAKMDLNIPIIPESLVYNMIFQDVFKIILILGVFLFQLKLYKKQEYLTSILLYFVAIFIYNLRYFFL